MWNWLARCLGVSKEMEPPTPHPLNAPGEFYCAEDICLGCQAMEHEAPDLIGWDDAKHGCYVKRQPTSDEETYRILQAMSVNEVWGLRYRGDDPELGRRIAEAGLASCCDRPCGNRAARVARTRAWITLDDAAPPSMDDVVAALFASVLHTNVPGGELDRTTRVARAVAALTESGRPAPIPSLERIDGGFKFDLRPFPAAATTTVRVCVSDDGRAGLDCSIGATGFYEQLRTSVLVDDFLRKCPGVRSIRWFTEAEWTAGRRGGRDTAY